jgi:MFS family permease
MNAPADMTWTHPSRRPYRFAVLLVAAFFLYGSYFAYDSVGAIEDYLMKSMNIGQSEVGSMYSLYSWGAIFTLFFAGWLIDRIGTRRSSLFFAGVVTLGAVIVAAAPGIRTVHVGRFVFGAGSEALIVTQSAILARWFRGKELAFAFGASLTIMRLATMFSFNTEALIAERMGPGAALWVAAGLCALSTGASALYYLLDRHAEPVLGLSETGAQDRINLGEMLKFRVSYWHLAFLCLCFYSAIFPFTSLSTNFFHEKWALPLAVGAEGGFVAAAFANFRHMFSTAPGTTSIVTFMSLLFAPFAGILIDRLGRRATIMALGCALMIPVYLLLGYTMLAPRYPMLLLGAAFVLVPAALWPAVPLIVKKDRLGTAYGLMTLIQNFGLMLFPWLNGRLRESTGTYAASMVMFSCLGAVALALALVLLSRDRAGDGVLERP